MLSVKNKPYLLSAVMLNVVMLSVIIPSVVAPHKTVIITAYLKEKGNKKKEIKKKFFEKIPDRETATNKITTWDFYFIFYNF
jgi:hypothetical protein